MVFCNKYDLLDTNDFIKGHNPYFNRWFSAISGKMDGIKPYSFVTILILIDGFLPFPVKFHQNGGGKCHNPYFNRWFSAI